MPYQGQLMELPGGVGTLTSDNNAARARHLDLIEAEGIVSDKGVWEREPGATPYTNDTLTTQALAFSFATPRNAGAVAASLLLNGAFANLGQFGSVTHINEFQSIVVGSFAPLQAVPSGATVVISWVSSDATGLVTITDTVGNTYVKLGEQAFGSGSIELWAAFNVAPLALGQHVVLQKAIAGGVALAVAQAYSGVEGEDQVINFGGSFGSSIVQATPFTLAADSEAVIVAVGDDSNGSGITSTHTEIVRDSTLAFGFSTNLFSGPLPFGTVAPNALSDYWVNSTTQRLLALGSDGIVYKSSGAAFTPLAMASVMTNNPGMIVIGGQEAAGRNRKAFFFDSGNTRIQTLTADGVATTDFGGWDTATNIPLDWATNPPRGGVIHKERLWCWAPNNAPHNIYASKLRDHENFKNAVGGLLEYVQEIGTGKGLRIAAAVSFKGMLFVGKYPQGIYYLDDTDVDYLNWRWNLVSDAVGVADSPNSMIVLDDDVAIVDPSGHVHFLSAITQQGVATSDMTAKFNLQQWTKENVNLNQLHKMSSCWYGGKKVLFLGVCSIDQTSNNLRLMLDFSNAFDEGQTVRVSYSHRDINRVLATRRDGLTNGNLRPIFGDDDGKIWLMDQDAKIKVGVPNAGLARYQYNPTDFSHLDGSLANKRKIFDALTIVFNPTGSWNLAVDSVIDGRYQETLYFSMGGAASVLGTFALGERLGGGTITTSRRRMTGHGYWLSLGGYVASEGHDFSVAKHLVNFRLGGEEQRARR